MRQFTDDMAEISGFGGGYEAGCRAMVLAGIAWLEAHPDSGIRLPGPDDHVPMLASDPRLSDFANAVAMANDGCSGIQVWSAMSHAEHAWRIGWEAYVAESKRRHAQRAATNPSP